MYPDVENDVNAGLHTNVKEEGKEAMVMTNVSSAESRAIGRVNGTFPATSSFNNLIECLSPLTVPMRMAAAVVVGMAQSDVVVACVATPGMMVRGEVVAEVLTKTNDPFRRSDWWIQVVAGSTTTVAAPGTATSSATNVHHHPSLLYAASDTFEAMPVVATVAWSRYH